MYVLNIMTMLAQTGVGIQLTIYYIFINFFLYSFIGWCAEVAFAALKERKVRKPWFFKRTVVSGVWNWCHGCCYAHASIQRTIISSLHIIGCSCNRIGMADRFSVRSAVSS